MEDREGQLEEEGGRRVSRPELLERPGKRPRTEGSSDSFREKSVWEMNDAEVVLRSTVELANNDDYPFVFAHQILHLLSLDQSSAQNCLDQLRKSKEFKLLHFGHLLSPQDTFFTNCEVGFETAVILPTSYFLNSIEEILLVRASDENRPAILQKLRALLTSADSLSFTTSRLIDEPFNFSGTEIEQLLRIGVFCRKELISSSEASRGEVFWLSHPYLGKVLQSVRLVGDRLLRSLRRKKYKELSGRELRKLFTQQQSSSATIPCLFSLEYHLLDLCGRNVIRKVQTPTERDVIYRLVAS